MSQNAKYTYIQWLPENRIITAIQQSMLADKYISGLFGNNIYGYRRDDNATFMLPSISINHGKLFSYDNYDRLEGEIVLNLFFGIDLVRDMTTEVIQSSLSTVRMRTQNPNFASSVALNMFEYNKTLASMPTTFAKNEFKKAMQTKHPLERFGISLEVTPADSYTLNGNNCYKATISYKYWIGQQSYYEFLELLGISGYDDPNKIVSPTWEQTDINIKEL